MTATQTAGVEAAQAAARVAPVAAGVRMRRCPALVAVSVALVVLGALLSVWAYLSLGSAQPVVGVRQDVARGSVISASDLEVVRVGVDPALATVPADRLEALVGQRAAVDLRAGQLMVPTGVTQDVAPHKGMSVLGLALAPGQLPSQPLRVGDRVRVVSTPGQQGDVVAQDVRVFAALVVQVGAADVSGRISVSVEVAEQQAPELAARSASGKVALVVDAREG
ncbi:SAF domain-containing protein [Luteococcus sp. OSA5]|uniref:SAF domain-containing protein n=1 Tax=Luteococcus sp. OSA5 TaxID=3401630 RepID=UPI003B430FA6